MLAHEIQIAVSHLWIAHCRRNCQHCGAFQRKHQRKCGIAGKRYNNSSANNRRNEGLAGIAGAGAFDYGNCFVRHRRGSMAFGWA